MTWGGARAKLLTLSTFAAHESDVRRKQDQWGKDAARPAAPRRLGEHALKPFVLLPCGDQVRAENHALAKPAVDALLDRGFGRPSQEVGLVADVTARIQVVERRIVHSES